MKTAKATEPLELIFIGVNGDKIRAPCEGLAMGKGLIPGLDASFCRCPECLARSSRGVWWVDQQMRDRLTLRKGKQVEAAD